MEVYYMCVSLLSYAQNKSVRNTLHKAFFDNPNIPIEIVW